MFNTTDEILKPDSVYDQENSDAGKLVSHRGVITEIDRDVIRVNIIAESACSACHAKGFCTAADQKEKVIEAPNRTPNSFRIGDNVEVTIKKSLGLKAVLYGYFLPFLVMIITLITTYDLTGNQGIAGISALIVLVPCYLVLYLVRDKLRSQFQFEVRY